MTELYDIPAEVKAALETKGIPYEKVDIAAKTDLDDGCVPCDNYIFVTDGDIIILAGSMTSRLKRNGIFKQPKPERHFLSFHTLIIPSQITKNLKWRSFSPPLALSRADARMRIPFRGLS